MLASETDRGRRWLSNFQAVDQPTARQLLDALELVGQDEWRSSLRQLLNGLPAKITGPMALVPVRELPAGQSYFSEGRDAAAPLLDAEGLPGSEALVANLITSLCREAGQGGPFVAPPSLDKMRTRKVRSIVLVDDFSGSGQRILGFLEAFRRHPTVASWRSLHLFDFHVALYSATRPALERLTRSFGTGHIHICRPCPTFATRNWRHGERRDIEAFCRKYVSSRQKHAPFGFKGSRGLMAFVHTAPNNLPAVVWQTRGRGPGGAWRPFFEGKAVPDDLGPLFFVADPQRRLASALSRLGQDSLAIKLDSLPPPWLWQRVLLALVAVGRNPRDDLRVAELTGLSLANTLEAVATARNYGLVTDRGLHLTDLGRSELRHAQSVGLPTAESSLKPSTLPYYPKSLRVGR